MQRSVTVIIVLLAALIWRAKKSLIFLSPPDLPAGYYSNGDWTKQCQTITHKTDDGLRYCEDAVFWDHLDSTGKQSNRLLLLSCDPGRKAWNTVMGPLRNPKPHGGLWVYALDEKNKKQPHRVTLNGYPQNHDFHPLGIDISPSHNGNPSNLFVINHARQRTTIEQFTISPNQPTEAKWIRTISSKYFVAPNALALTSSTSFYVTNDHLMTRRLPKPFGDILPLVETWLGLPFGWASHVSIGDSQSTDPENEVVINHAFAALGIPFANGIALSHNGTTVAIASSSGALVYIYTRDPSTNTLSFKHTVPVPFLADNIMYDDDDQLIVTGHPHLPALVDVASNVSGRVSPSWIVSISPRKETEGKPEKVPKTYDTRAPLSASSKVPAVRSHEVETLFQSNGEFFSTSSTGLRDSRTGKLYVVGLYSEGFLVCTP